MKITFLLSNLPNPRNLKRIKFFSTSHEVHVVCIQRTNQDLYNIPKIDGVMFHTRQMELPTIKNIWKRYKASNKFREFLEENLYNINPDIIYTGGLDCLMAVEKYKKGRTVKVIYEVADLRSCFLPNPNKGLIRKCIDKFISLKEQRTCRIVNNLVVTSEKFYDLYYYKIFPKEKVLFIPNMPELTTFEAYVHKSDKTQFVVGFIGALRYIPQMYMLIEAAKKADIKVVFAGGGEEKESEDFFKYCATQPHVEVLGKYNYSTDIASLYGKMDAIYSVYDTTDINSRIALPNKLYESIYCQLPLIVSENTYLAELVNKWEVGVAIDPTSLDDLTAILIRLKVDQKYYQHFQNCCENRKKDIDINKYLEKLNEIII